MSWFHLLDIYFLYLLNLHAVVTFASRGIYILMSCAYHAINCPVRKGEFFLVIYIVPHICGVHAGCCVRLSLSACIFIWLIKRNFSATSRAPVANKACCYGNFLFFRRRQQSCNLIRVMRFACLGIYIFGESPRRIFGPLLSWFNFLTNELG